MRKIFLILLVLACSCFLHAQNKINSYEYWFDNGYAQKVQTGINPVAAFNLNENVSVNALSGGLHTYNIRFRDDSLRYSSVTTQFFIKLPASVFPNKQIVQYEYWFDKNYAQKVSQPVTAQSSFQLNTNLNLVSLSTGLHNINIRFKDDAGLWSAAISQFIVKLPSSVSANKKIVEYEYWFDKNYIQKVSQAITAQSSFELITNLNTGLLTSGLHNINIRFKDNAGLWSSAISQFIVKLPTSVSSNKQIVGYEYWFDNGYSQKVFAPVTPQGTLQLVTNIGTGSLGNGLHTISIRFKDDAGLWSATVSQFVIKLSQSVSANKQIVEYEYWFDNSYAQKITETVAPQSLLQLDTGLNTASLNRGLHSFKIRFKDNSGLWSSTLSQYIFKRSSASSEFNLITAYRYWFDRKDSTMTTVKLPFPTNPYLLVTKINVTALDTGFHSVQFQFKDTNDLWSLPTNDTFYQVGKPALNSILPNNGSITGDVTVNITGNGFFPGTSVKLTRTGHADIVVPDSLTLIQYGTRIRATFDLHNADTGYWNVVVTVPDDTVMMLMNGFRVDSGVAATTYSNLIGFSSIRLNRWTPVTIAYGNSGNVNASATNIYLAVSDTNTKINFDFKVIRPERDSLFNYDTIPNYFLIDTLQGQPFKGKVYQFVIPNIPPNSTGTMTFKTLVTTSQPLKIATWTNPPLYKSKFLDADQVDCFYNSFNLAVDVLGDFSPPVDCFYSIFDNFYSPIIKFGLTGQSDYSYADIGAGLVKSSTSCISVVCPLCKFPEWFKTFKDISDKTTDILSIANSCSKAFSKINVNKLNVSVINSYDPNEKLGPAGFGSNNYFNANVPYPYIIHFENVDSATAPAQSVLITDTLDQNVFDVNTLELGFIKIGDTIFNLPAGIKTFDDYIDLRPKRNIILKTKAGFNDTTGVLSWEFTSLDPLTYLPVTDPEAAFLPPNVTAPEGEGSVFYTIRLKDSLAYGTSIANKACIYFDNNAQICTNKWTNTIDNIKPVSKVDSLASPTKGISFTVNWSGADTGSGVKNYSIYYSVNGGSYTSWIVNTSATNAVFTGMIDSTYRFYSIALDSAGNYESTALAPDAVTTVKSDFTWIGITSTDWSIASNWSGAVVPGANNDAYIQANTPFSATIPAGITVSCKSISILPGAVLIVGENAHLNVMH